MSADDIIRKIVKTKTPEVKRVAVAYSGGLDSTLGIELLRRIYRAEEILPITVDVGQGDEEIRESKRKAKILGINPILIDAKKEFTETWMAKAIQANSDYEGYPVSTSMTRQLVAKIVGEKATKLRCDAVLEGSSGKGNDQFRMHNVFKLFAPKLKVLVPVRDFDLTRHEEELLCREWNIPVTEMISGGDDKTMWCRSIASGAVDLNQELPDEIWMWYQSPERAPEKPTILEIEFKRGIPTTLNKKRMPLSELVPKLNEIGGKNAIGKIDMFEDGIMGLKSREIYEAPAAKIILKLHRDLEQFCLTKEEVHFKKIIDHKWAYMVYHGEWFHPLKNALDRFIESTQEYVNGTYKIKLYKGDIDILSRESKTGLFSKEIRSIKSRGFDQRLSAGATTIFGLQWEILSKRAGK